MGENIDLKNLGIGTSFDFQRKTLNLIVDTVKKLRYCDGVTDGDYKTTLKYFREQVTKVGEYTNIMRSCEGTALNVHRLMFTVIVFISVSNLISTLSGFIWNTIPCKPFTRTLLRFFNNTDYWETHFQT